MEKRYGWSFVVAIISYVFIIIIHENDVISKHVFEIMNLVCAIFMCISCVMWITYSGRMHADIQQRKREFVFKQSYEPPEIDYGGRCEGKCDG